MKFTINWLKQYVDYAMPSAELADRLTMAGLEVDSVDDIFAGLDQVRVAEITGVEPHPNADRLVLCQVQVGEESLKVVCGAPNARAGLFTAIALPGAVMPGGLKIRKGKIRGEKSHGMLCSAKDVGISEEHEGIMELDGVETSGGSLVELLGLADTLIEVDLTPNRPDCASVIGTAREVAAFAGTALKLPVADKDLPALAGSSSFSVDVTSDDCPRYAARLIRGVKVGPSPWWLQKRLLSVGLRPISNIVDITNFVMLEYGQPMHAFDFQKLAGGRIIVRKAADGEKMTTLDGVDRSLDQEMLMICDTDKPVAVAGVMGGSTSEVSEATVDVLLESACFDPVSIRRTARRLNLSTDSSYRFERGVDPEAAPRAMERAVRLILELAGGEVEDGGIDVCQGVNEPTSIKLRPGRVSDLLGLEFSVDDISSLLEPIDIKVSSFDQDTLLVTPPTFRVDLEREVDLVEELARLKGYNEFPETMPLVPMGKAWDDKERDLRKQVASLMLAAGFNESINYSFVSPDHADLLLLGEDDPRRQVVTLLNPLAEDQSVMRTSLLPGLLENVRYNINHQSGDLRFFEIGKAFQARTGQQQPDEHLMLTAVMTGARHPGSSPLYFNGLAAEFVDIKGVAEQLMADLRLPQVNYSVDGDLPSYAAAASYLDLVADGRKIGEIGAIKQEVVKGFAIKQDVFFLTCELDAILALETVPRKFAAIPKFPAVKWDIAMLVPESVGAGEMVTAIKEAGEDLVEDAFIFDVYRGKPIEDGYKSVAVTVVYRSYKETLDDETVGKVHQRLTDMTLTRFFGRLREE